MSTKTGFVWNEFYAWHNTGTAAGFAPPGGFVQPHQHMEHPESKRRLAELISVSGLKEELENIKPRHATEEELLRFHTADYVKTIQKLSADNGGDAGELTPFGKGGYDIATLSAGGCIELLQAVWDRRVKNGYALNRPPGHHAEADRGRGFCVFGNGVIAIRHLQATSGVKRVAVVDWDVHHGNSAQGAFYADPSVLTISIHEDGNYPQDSGWVSERGTGDGLGSNLNIPLPAGSGHAAYVAAFKQVVLPALKRFKPEIIVVHSGFDACAMDPVGHMLLHSESYRELTQLLMTAADTLCGGKLAMFHEGGYSIPYVPYCGLAVMEELSGIRTEVEDPFLDFWRVQPAQKLRPHQQELINELAALVPKIPV